MTEPDDASLPSPAELERFACATARAAGAILRRRFGDELRVEQKGLHDFVTAVDREAEATIVERIRARFPEHQIMAEEGSPELRAARLRWVIDPLDGTTNFIHGVPTFGVSIALEDDAGPLVGVVHDPLRDETFHATRGGGARLDGRPIRCSAPAAMGQALIATGYPYRVLDRLDRYLEAFEAFVRTTAGLRRAGAACIDLAYTACGRYDGFWEVGLSRWDVAAGVLLVGEAGGTVTDVGGNESALETGDVVAAGKGLHPRMVEITRRAFGR